MPRLDGIDIYHGQYDAGPVDLITVAAIPTWWFAAKATQSTSYADPTHTLSMSVARNLFTHRISYHWLSSITNPITQAEWFLAHCDGDGGAMLDAEESGITAAECLAWCETVEKARRRPTIVYSGLYVSGGTIWKSIPLRTSQYGPRPFIVAAYVSAANIATRMVSTGSTPNFPHDGWQYSSNGPVAGITGRCDMDQIDNVAAFDLACGIAAAPPIGDDDMQVATFEVEGLPGVYMWAPGMPEPIPFTSIADLQGLATSLGSAGNGTKISKEMYDRLFIKPPTITLPPIVVPPAVFPPLRMTAVIAPDG